MILLRRNRILRQSPAIRSLVAETILRPSDFIAPLFIDEGENIAFEIPWEWSMTNGSDVDGFGLPAMCLQNRTEVVIVEQATT